MGGGWAASVGPRPRRSAPAGRDFSLCDSDSALSLRIVLCWMQHRPDFIPVGTEYRAFQIRTSDSHSITRDSRGVTVVAFGFTLGEETIMRGLLLAATL